MPNHFFSAVRPLARAARIAYITVLGLLAALYPAAPARADATVSTLGVRFRNIDITEYRACVLDFRVLAKGPPDFPEAAFIVDGSLAYAVPRSGAAPRIGLSVVFSKEFKRELDPLDKIYVAYVRTRSGTTGNSLADRVPDTPKTVASFAFALDPSSRNVLKDVRNGDGFTLAYRLTANSDEHSLPVDMRIADSTFMGGKLTRFPSAQATHDYAACVDRLEHPNVSLSGRSEAEAQDLSKGFGDWIRHYSPFPSDSH
jgi:hypothetical protein